MSSRETRELAAMGVYLQQRRGVPERVCEETGLSSPSSHSRLGRGGLGGNGWAGGSEAKADWAVSKPGGLVIEFTSWISLPANLFISNPGCQMLGR